MAVAVVRSPLFLWYLLILAAIVFPSNGKDVRDCTCGYYDGVTQEFFTDSAIVYFNETDQVPAEVFISEAYESDYEKGWNSRFRQGANRSNVVLAQDYDGISSNASLHLYVDPSTPEHLVVGGGLQTSRRDIFYGSFRALLQSPSPWLTGSALSMTLNYNDTQTINMDAMNPTEETAWVAMLSHREFPSRDLGVNYSVLSNSTNNISPWDFTEFRIDWTEKEVNYYIGGKLFRSILKSDAKDFPQTPTMLRLKHWSVGDWFTMQGPPVDRSVANVGWVRMFFNSSLATNEDRGAFAKHCSSESACATEDMGLRGSSLYGTESTTRWVQAPNPTSARTIPKVILIVTGAISAFLIANALLKRIPRRSTESHKSHKSKSQHFEAPEYETSTALISEAATALPPTLPSALASANVSRAGSFYESGAAIYFGSRAASFHGGADTPNVPTISSKNSLGPYLQSQMGATTPSGPGRDEGKRPRLSWREFSDKIQQLKRDEDELAELGPYRHYGADELTHEGRSSEVSSVLEVKGSTINSLTLPERMFSSASGEGQEQVQVQVRGMIGRTYGTERNYPPLDMGGEASLWTRHDSSRGNQEGLESEMLGAQAGEVMEVSVPSKNLLTGATSVRLDGDSPRDDTWCSCPEHLYFRSASNIGMEHKQIDYLAGLLAFSCLLVTAIQFTLTFSPASIDPGADVHYKTESWARKTVEAYFLNLVWVGPFLITSARFLVSRYLENGDLLDIAHKVVGRPFRLLLPVLAIAMLEYFFMDSGATNWLEYLPSVTWSTWPFTTVPNNFGYFISEILELAYLIPNAAPQITFNYCTGVLWTIPVQLQNSWVALLGVIVVRQIKTPWKRFGFYLFCMLVHWYALSWGSYFYFGMMLADLDITYKYRKWLHARPDLYFLLTTLLIVMTVGGLSLDMVTQLTQVNYASYEYGIHPDIPTGKPIMYTGATGYPQYYVPKLNGIVFAFGLQALVELSPIVQRVFSFRWLLYMFPHIYTIYLIHGFIFWSLGPTVFIYLSVHGLSYGLIVTLVAICCYAALFLSVFLLTPIVNTLGNGDNIWVFAHEIPSPRKPTLYPFPSNFLFVRQEYIHPVLENATPGEMPVMVTKDRGHFQKLVLGLIAAVVPRFSSQHGQHSKLSVSRSNSVFGPGVPARSVGWRTAGLSRNVTMLKRNNSNASRGRTLEDIGPLTP